MEIKKIKYEKAFFKKEERPDFYIMLLEQCEITSKSVSKLHKFMINHDLRLAEEIEKCEVRADKVRHKLIDYVENTFITPLDRHDIFALSRRIDDVTDKVKDLKDFIIYFDYEPDSTQIEILTIIESSIKDITKAVRNWKKPDDENFWMPLINVNKNRDTVKRLYWQTIDTVSDYEYNLHDATVMIEFSKELHTLSHKTGKAGDRLGDVMIKSIK